MKKGSPRCTERLSKEVMDLSDERSELETG